MKLPKGFLAAGVRSGVRKRRPDLALIVAEKGATAAALFTRNRFPAAPVVLSRSALSRTRGRVRAAVINAGCANAITGRAGTDAARRVRRRAAELLRCAPDEVFLASTGVIGVPLPDGLVRAALPAAVARLSAGGLDAASHAILTTDVGPKIATATFRANGRLGRVVGFAKGAGMIHPDMATMLAFVMTDASASPAYLKAALRRAADESFNAISVDGDTSTNDTVLLLASGANGAPPVAEGSASAEFERALTAVCRELAWRIVRDGEGATRVMEILVQGAATAREARLAAEAVATSPLVKTALHGGDPNWGRILAAVGRSGARIAPARARLAAGTLCLVEDGSPVSYRERDAARIFARERVPVTVDLGIGSASARVLASDLGHDYVSLNADYRS
jgi:glutamate N-acetyltransferase/amino-acid N-acetyltransferase